MRIGIDIGGTNLVAAAVNERGEILKKVHCPTVAKEGYGPVVNRIVALVKTVITEMGQPEFIGAGVPGIISSDGSRVISCPNLGWMDQPLKDTLEACFKIPVKLGNDATVAGIAENRFGSTRGYEDAVMFTLGTGVGGSVILGGRVITGSRGAGSEFGHIVLDESGPVCGCGKRGCLETYASSTAVIRKACQALEKGETSMIQSFCDGDLSRIDAKMIMDAAKAGDRLGMACVTQMAKALGRAIGIISDIIDPAIVVLGGGVAQTGEFLRQRVEAEAQKQMTFKALPMPEIVLASLQNDAGLVGAAYIDLYYPQRNC